MIDTRESIGGSLRGVIPDQAAQQQFWNDWNDKYRGPGHEAHLDPPTRRRRETVLQWVEQLNLSRPQILDLGCATGWLTAQLTEFGQARGTDIADASIRQAKQRYPDIAFDCGDFSSLGYERESFDVVVSLETLSHVADQPTFVQRIAHVLKPGGYLILTTQNRFVFERRADVAPRGAGQIRQWVTGGELRRLLRDDFVVRRFTTLIPAGDSGILRVVNSPRINRVLGRFVSRAAIERAKERFGLGQTIAVLAQRR